MNKLKYLGVFAIGTAIGSFVTWKIVKDKYEKIAQEEIDSVKATYSKRQVEDDLGPVEPIIITTTDGTKDKEDYSKIIHASNYSEKIEEEMINDMDEPYVITPDEFDEFDSYDTETLYYYADGTLTDTQNNIVEDIDDIVGVDSLEHFGEWEDDAVYVRNDRLECDYEILKDSRTFDDAMDDYDTEG